MNSTRQEPLVRIGDVLRIPEEHYLYGVGTLTLRVTAVDANISRHPGLEWLQVRGVELHSNGTDGDVREVAVRVSALHYPGAVTRTPDDRNDTTGSGRIRAFRTRI